MKIELGALMATSVIHVNSRLGGPDCTTQFKFS